jgi:hypothetical protein
MVRYLIAAVLGCLYVAGSIWIVRSQGQSYRQGLTKRKPAVREVAGASPSLTPAKDQAVRAVAASETNAPPPKPATSQPARTPVAEAAARASADVSPPIPPANDLAKTTSASSAPPKNVAAHPAGSAVPANPLANNAFWNRPQLTRVRDVAQLTPREESELGADFHDLIIQLNLLVKEGPWLSRVEDAAEPLLKFVDRKEIHYKFFILNSDDVNAFSTPGGYIYVSRGLFDLIGEDEEYALQFAVGHEMAHVDRQHAIQCLCDPDVRKIPLGTLQKLYWLIFPAGYLSSDKVDQEFEADEWVANRMQRLQRTRREILIFLNKFEGYAKAHSFVEGRAEPRPDHDVSMLDNHYRAQTGARKRFKHLKAIMDKPANALK